MTSLDLSEEARESAELLCYVLRQSPVEFASQAVEDAIDAALDDPIVRAAFDAMEALRSRSESAGSQEAQRAHNPSVPGATPGPATTSPPRGVPSTNSEGRSGVPVSPAEKPQVAARRSIERAVQRVPAKPAPPSVPRGEIPGEESRRKSASALRTARGELGILMRDAAQVVGLDEDVYHAIECARPVGAHLVRGAVRALASLVEERKLVRKAAQ